MPVPDYLKPNQNHIRFVLMTPKHNYAYNLRNANEIVNNQAFNRKLKTVFYVMGWLSNFNSNNTELNAVFYAYMCRGDANFIVRFFLLL